MSQQTSCGYAGLRDGGKVVEGSNKGPRGEDANRLVILARFVAGLESEAQERLDDALVEK